MTRSRFFSSSDQSRRLSVFEVEPSAAPPPVTSTSRSNKSAKTTSRNTNANGLAPRWRRRLRRSHAHDFNEGVLPEKPVLAAALSRDSLLGSGCLTEAPSSRGTSVETLSACSPALEGVADGSLDIDDFDLDGENSWLEAELPPLELPAAAAAAVAAAAATSLEDQPQRWVAPLELHVKDFECGECVGKGSYSKVFLGRHVPTGTEWALKVVSKRKTFETRENLLHLREERYISTKLQGSDFLVRTAGTFQNPRSVVFAMEYLPGGDLYQRLSDKGTLSLRETIAWTAQAVLAIEDLHGKNIVHRDVKPENFLMGKSGTLKLTDFGFARELGPNERLYSQFGTPEYVAAEVLNGSGHGMPVDLWALGVLIYELLVGQTPFKSASVEEMYERIAVADYAFPAPPAPRASTVCAAAKDSYLKPLSKTAKSSPLTNVPKWGGGGGAAGCKRGASSKKAEPEGEGAAAAASKKDGLMSAGIFSRITAGCSSAEHVAQSNNASLRQHDQEARRHHQHQQQQSNTTTTITNNTTTTTTNNNNNNNKSSNNSKSSNTKNNKSKVKVNTATAKSNATTAENKSNIKSNAGAQDPAAQSLVKALLCVDPGRRPSVFEVKRHPFFAGVDFDGLRAAVRAQTEREEEEAVVTAAIEGGDVWVRGQPVMCRSDEVDDNYGGVFVGF